MSIKNFGFNFESTLTDFSAEYDGHKAPCPLGGRQWFPARNHFQQENK